METQEWELDLRGAASREELRERIAEALPLPEWYGGTLDSLFDVLSAEISGGHLTVYGIREAEETIGRYAINLAALMERAATENPGFTVEWAGENRKPQEEMTARENGSDRR